MLRLALYEEQSLTALSQGYWVLVVVAVEQDFQCKLGVGVSGLDVPTSVVVADDLTVSLKHQLADLATFDTELGRLVKNLQPVMKYAVINLKTTFLPHFLPP